MSSMQLLAVASLADALVARPSLDEALDALACTARALLPGARIELTADDVSASDLDPGDAIKHVPVRIGDEIVGSLSASIPEGFSDRDAIVLDAVAALASFVVEHERLRRLAVTDHRTLAFNERYLEPRLREEMDRAIRHDTPLSVMLLDLDRFKSVNDGYGHAVGDYVLRTFVDLVKRSVRLTDVLVRRGGEEFFLIMPHTDAEQGAGVAERVRASLDGKAIVLEDGRELRQTVSIGVATWDRSEDVHELERRADLAMYRAKTYGRNAVVAA